MKKHYLHLAVYRCDKCQGPVVTGSIAVRESEISKETEQQEIGAICVSCGHRQIAATAPAVARHLMPMEWGPPDKIKAPLLPIPSVEAVKGASSQ